MGEENIINQQELSEVMRVRREKLSRLIEEGRDPFAQTVFERTSDSESILSGFDTMEGQTVRLAGRIMSKRDMGKASFSHIRDHKGLIQLYSRVDELGEQGYEEFKKLDIGDIIGVEGFVFKTKRGEVSVHVTSYVLLSKSLRPLPEKWHGLRDTDTRYRQRYVDLIVNSEVRDTFVKRSRIISEIRAFLDGREFLEVETPVLQTLAGGASARPFITHHNALGTELYLRISLELYLKRLIVGGLDRVYEVGRVFRNEGLDVRHNPEFTLLELYQAYTDINGMMELTENMIRTVAMNVLGTGKVTYGDKVIDLETPFAKMSMTEAVLKYTGVDFDKITTMEEAQKVAEQFGLKLEPRHGRGDVLSMLFDEKCEDKLIQPVFITSHPVEISPLAKKDPQDPKLTQRFELYINGTEFANAFSELNDPIDQRERFEKQMRLKAMGDDEAQSLDEDFLTALEFGMPPTGGMGMGVDRLVMLLTDSSAIRDVLFFPTMKPLNAPKKEIAPSNNEPVEIDFSNVVIEPLFKDLVDFETFSKSDLRAVKVISCEAVPKSKKLLKFILDDGSGEERTILSGIHAFYEPEELVGKTCVAITNLPPRAMMGIESCGMLLSAVHHEQDEEKLNLLMLDPRIPAGAKLY